MEWKTIKVIKAKELPKPTLIPRRVEVRKNGKLIAEYDTPPTRLSDDAVATQERRSIARHLAEKRCHMVDVDVDSELFKYLYKYYYKYFDIEVYNPDEVQILRKWMDENFSEGE